MSVLEPNAGGSLDDSSQIGVQLSGSNYYLTLQTIGQLGILRE
jgi:hypothetical protein